MSSNIKLSIGIYKDYQICDAFEHALGGLYRIDLS